MLKMTPNSIQYRPDIDGLRAFAVLAVLGFHAFPSIIPGGFVGVDVFFVISGFLISGIILYDLERGRFTFAGFYARRIRRIFPALALVLIACLAYGWWALMPFDFRQLGAQVATGAGFVSNVFFWTQSGYFDTAAELKPLLHLWSLGVEEQYYFVWPMLLFLMRNHVPRILWMILCIAGISFALNVLAIDRYPTAVFYLPATRFWELMIGTAIALLTRYPAKGVLAAPWLAHSPALSNHFRNLAGIAGITLIGVAIAILDPNRSFPGWWALIPTAGAGLVISAGDAWVNRLVLANRGMVYIGLISYPLYLWHWPILTYARIFVGGELSVVQRAFALLVSVVLASLTYELVEKKIRHARISRSFLRPLPILVTSMAALGIFGMTAYANYSRARSDAIPNIAPVSAALGEREEFREVAALRGDTDESVMFFGDSHMAQYMPRIVKLMHDQRAPRRTVVIRLRYGCAPIPDVERRKMPCNEFVAKAYQRASGPDIRIVVFGASWVGFADRLDYYNLPGPRNLQHDPATFDVDSALNGFEEALRRLVAEGKHVVIILSSPRGRPFDPRNMVRRTGFDYQVDIPPPVLRSEIVADNAPIDDRLKGIARRVGADLIDPLDCLCTKLVCPTAGNDGSPFFKDESHLRSSVVNERFDALDKYVYLAGSGRQRASR